MAWYIVGTYDCPSSLGNATRATYANMANRRTAAQFSYGVSWLTELAKSQKIMLPPTTSTDLSVTFPRCEVSVINRIRMIPTIMVIDKK
jgi:hypothetical protein